MKVFIIALSSANNFYFDVFDNFCVVDAVVVVAVVVVVVVIVIVIVVVVVFRDLKRNPVITSEKSKFACFLMFVMNTNTFLVCFKCV